MTDEHLLTAAKLREVVRGRLRGERGLHPHAGLVDDELDRSALSFTESAYHPADVQIDDAPARFEDTELGRAVSSTFLTDAATRAVHEGNSTVMSHIVGVTEQRLEADQFTYLDELVKRVYNDDAPLILIGFGGPNTGKTGHILHDWRRAWRNVYPDGLMVSNSAIEGFDERITSLDELVEWCVHNRDRQKFVFVDEGSTIFDARTNSYEVATQFTPFMKRFAKLGIDFATAGHSGMDIHPELKRLATTFFLKTDKKTVQFYDDYEDDDLVAPVFPAPVTGLEKPTGYDPDDWSPLRFDVDPEVFTLDFDDLLARYE